MVVLTFIYTVLVHFFIIKEKVVFQNSAYYSEKTEEIKNNYYNSKTKQNAKIDINTTKFICAIRGFGNVGLVVKENGNEGCTIG